MWVGVGGGQSGREAIGLVSNGGNWVRHKRKHVPI